MSGDSSVSGSFKPHQGLQLVANLLAAAALAGCGTAPLSFINDHQVTQRTELHRFPVFVVSIDGTSTSFKPIPIAPGEHTLVIDAPPVAGFSQSMQKTYPMTIAPCTRYFIAAQRRSAFAQDWDLVVEETHRVAACNPQQELQKARIAANGNASVASSSTIASMPARAIDTTVAQIAPR